jgi:N-methylhydantoinase A/oxoprolinase/acetone carboxylase beta subunit
LSYRIGVDVGSTHTDAVVLDQERRLIKAIKTGTTPDTTTGIVIALRRVLTESGVEPSKVKAVMLGTTHCLNALIERKRLAKTAVLRIGKPATLAIAPLTTFPSDLKAALGGFAYIVSGGHEFDGREIAPLSEAEIKEAAHDMKAKGVEAVAVCSVFSPVDPSHERRAAQILMAELGEDVPITLSSELASIGLLERENAAAMNASLIKVAKTAIEAFKRALAELGLGRAKLFMSQNDGTLMSVEYALRYPILTIACGPTNSMRGAAYLVGLSDAIVVDVGGTTALFGALSKGFPRESALAVEIGGVKTNFRMPDLVSIGCGGGAIVRVDGSRVTIGPDSVGYLLTSQGMAWGGRTLTTTDVALAAGYAAVEDDRCDPQKLATLDKELVRRAVDEIVRKVQENIDKIKTSAEPMPVVLVGGGGIIVPPYAYGQFAGVSKVVRPEHFQYANAIGAAIAQVGGTVDRVFSLEKLGREEALKQAKEMAVEEAVRAGAQRSTVQIIDVDEIPLAYLPGNATRIRVKASGSLAL